MTIYIIFTILALCMSVIAMLATKPLQDRLTDRMRLFIELLAVLGAIDTFFILWSEGKSALGNAGLIGLFILDGILSILLVILFYRKQSKLNYTFILLSVLLWIAVIAISTTLIVQPTEVQKSLMLTSLTGASTFHRFLLLSFYILIMVPMLEFIICFVISIVDTTKNALQKGLVNRKNGQWKDVNGKRKWVENKKEEK